MRASIITGLLLSAAVVVLALLNAALDLEIDSFVLAGALVGGVAALVPDRSVLVRLVGVGVGLLAAWVGFLLRAGVLPDTTSAVVVAGIVVIAICVIAALASRQRLPLWSLLLGAGVLSAGYESAFSDAPAEVWTTSADALTALIVALVVGFVLVSVPTRRQEVAR